MEKKLGNPKQTIETIQKHGFMFQKKFGQNFLIDPHVLEKIINAAGVTKEDCVLEIGPGIGTLTQYLAETAGRVVAVEIDRNLIPILEETLEGLDNVTVINADIMKTDIRQIAETYHGGKPLKVVANLPYYITTPIVMGLLEGDAPVDTITVMVQKEVAERMMVGPGSKDYGALSLAVQYYAEPEIVANVPPNCFIPRTQCGFCGHPPYQACRAAGTGEASEADVSADSGFIQSAEENTAEQSWKCSGAFLFPKSRYPMLWKSWGFLRLSGERH